MLKKIVLLQTRILVTHNLQVLPSVDRIVVMEEGRIVEIGKYSDLNTRNEALLQKIKSADRQGEGSYPKYKA